MVATPVPSHGRIYAEQLIEFMITTASGTTKELALLRSRLEFMFFELWNVGFARERVAQHTCISEDCKCGGSEERLLELLTAAMRAVMYSRVMPRPALGKWLQLTNALRWLMLAQVGNFFSLLFTTTVQAMKFKFRMNAGKNYLLLEALALKASIWMLPGHQSPASAVQRI